MKNMKKSAWLFVGIILFALIGESLIEIVLTLIF